MKTSTETSIAELEKSARFLAWAVRKAFQLSLLAAAFVTGGCVVLLFFAHRLSTDHEFTKEFLVNLAASSAEIAVVTFFAALATWAIAQNKLRQLSRPVLTFIQRLRIDGRLSREGARRAVVCSVAIISEDNVSRAISPGVDKKTNDCPICAQCVRGETDRCSHCGLPESIWRDENLLMVHRSEPGVTPMKKRSACIHRRRFHRSSRHL
jgi:hypothetical protein